MNVHVHTKMRFLERKAYHKFYTRMVSLLNGLACGL